MYIVKQKLASHLMRALTFSPSYQAYIHLQDHDEKVNPKDTRLKLSYMNPNKIVEDVPANPLFRAKLRRSAEEGLKKRMFEQYKEKILMGKVDEEAVVEPDTLWGEGEIPAHYYQFLSSVKANRVSHSIFKDFQPFQIELGKAYVEKLVKTTNLDDVKEFSQLAEVAASYRLNGDQDRSKYYQIEQKIGNKFHLLSNQALVLLKYAYLTVPKKSTPEFNKILNDLLLQQLPNLSMTDLTALMYFNRQDLFRFHRGNLQIAVLEEASKHFKELNLQQKIDFLFLYIDSRSPTIRPESHNRYINEIRSRTLQIMSLLNIEGDFSALSELSFLKLAYSLVRGKTNNTEHLTIEIEEYVTANIDKIGINNLVLFFFLLSKIEAGKATSNLTLIASMKEKIISSWEQLNDLEKLRSLGAMLELNLYDEATHALYSAIPITADSTMLSIICKLEMMTSSGREWEVIHRLVDLEYIPLVNFQDYKRFYNYVSYTAPDWNLQPLLEKIQNTQIFYSSARYQSISQDKKTYRGLREFQKFSSIKDLPHKFKMGCPILNSEFGQFCLPQYQISVDIITDVERVRGTTELKGSYKLKMKNLQCIGWKQVYVMEEDIEKLCFEEFFDYLLTVSQPHFEDQLKIIAQVQEYRAYEIGEMKFKKEISRMKMRERELYDVVKDFAKVPSQYNLIQAEIARKEKIAQELLDMKADGSLGQEGAAADADPKS